MRPHAGQEPTKRAARHRIRTAGGLILAGFVLPVAAQDPTPPPPTAAPPPGGAIVRFHDKRQRIDGFGASSAWYEATVAGYAEPARRRIIEALFDAETGAGLSILRVRIDPRYYPEETRTHDFADEKMQRFGAFVRMVSERYRPLVLASPWTPPSWMKEPAQYKGGGVLKEEHYAAYATCLVSWVARMKRDFGVRIDALSLQNEPGRKTWESCEWKLEDFVRFLRDHVAPELAGAGIDVKVVANEETGWNDRWINRMLQDEAVRSRLDIAGVHAYHGGWENIRPFPEVRRFGKPLWMTEHFYEGRARDDMERALINARIAHDVLTRAEANAHLFWWLFARKEKGEHACLILLTDPEKSEFAVTKKLWGLGNFSRFIRPGFERVEMAPSDPAESLHVSAYRGSPAGPLVIVAVNGGERERALPVAVDGASPVAWTPWRTSAEEDLLRLEPVGVEAGSAVLTLAPRSITTYVATLGRPDER